MIDIQINNKNRGAELGLLLQSLRNQTEQRFDIYILDDASGTPITSYDFINKLFKLLQNEGHRVNVIRNAVSSGNPCARQKLAEHILKEGTGKYICRIDDDCIVEKDYLEKLMDVMYAGYDLASGVTPPIFEPMRQRDTKFVEPIINRVVLDGDGKFVVNADDCGHSYLQHKIIPMDHFRSSALYRKEIHKDVSYDTTLTVCGFREEQFFSFRTILAGYKLGCHTGAVAWHLITNSGGDRTDQRLTQENTRLNQVHLNRKTQQWFKKHGDFIEAYHKKLGIEETKEQKFATLGKNTNCIVSDEL